MGYNQRVTNLRGATPAVTTVAVTASATLLKGANADRRSLSIRNSSASAAPIWLGYANTVTAGSAGTNFEILYPGDSLTFDDYTGDVYGICEAGGTASVKVGEVAE